MSTHTKHSLNYKTPLRKKNIFSVIVLMLLMTTSILPVISAKPQQATLIFIAVADSQVNESNPSTNYGNSAYIQIDGASDPEVEGFFRFTVTGVSGTIQSALLRVYDTTNGSA